MLAWMDLEMTGLDPARHVIVEIATVVTDDDLNVVAVGPDLIIAATEDELAAMSDFVKDMHTRSGLLEQIRASTVSRSDAAAATVAFLKEHLPRRQSVPLAGNSIGTDRRFLAAQMPEVEDWLHYRSVDVSTLKELCRRWYPEALAGAPAKQTSHRAMDDILESVAELAYYRRSVFAPAPAPAATDAGATDAGATDAGATDTAATDTAATESSGGGTSATGTPAGDPSGAGTPAGEEVR